MEIFSILSDILLNFNIFPFSFLIIGTLVIYSLVGIVSSISKGG